jgi:DNA-binding MarR family transcriptional regulator
MTATLALSKEDNYHLITGRTTLLLNRYLTQQFRDAGIPISREQWSILAVLWIEDGCSQQVIATQTERDKPSTTRLLDTLEKDGYIVRKSDPNDKRINLIYLTKKGRSLEDRVNPIVYETLRQASEGLTVQEVKIVKLAFEKVYKNLMSLLK